MNPGNDEDLSLPDGNQLTVSDGDSCEPSSANNDDTSSASTSNPSTSRSGTRGHSIPEEIVAAKENLLVTRSRRFFIAALLISACAAGVMTWYFTRDSEERDFETQFSDYAFAIQDISVQKAIKVYEVAESFSVSLTSSALALNQSFPYVTMPFFEVRGEKYLHAADGLLVSYSPIVTDVEAWNTYSLQHQGWIQDSFDMRDDDTVPEPIREVYRKDQETGTFIQEVSGSDLYCPLWQESEAPHDTSVLNYNLLDHDIFRGVFDAMQRTRVPTLSQVFDPSTLLGEGAHLEFDDDEYEIHPESILLQPVYNSFDDTDREFVGTVITVLPWDFFFRNLLHEGADGIICVLDFTCNSEVFTYRIDGVTATYLGPGDLHDRKYNELGLDIPFGLLDENLEENCYYDLHVYPSGDLEDIYHTNKPFILTLIVLSIFLFTTSAFVLYDYLVQRRQNKLHEAAMKSNAIVSSLFPAEIRERLYQSNVQAERSKPESSKKTKSSSYDSAPKFRLKSYLDNDAEHSEVGEKNTDIPEMYETKPIADLFPNTTIMFADIAGFTAWSSVREPSQVFTLLETVYRAFDTIAKRRRVFKVETVGDCYVAVTGLPEPRKDHAIVMARFARDCMERMNELSHQLEVILGPDTGDLAMRFGLHSGPVTAGVLRGDKSRFQLFGDSVNTAARIETTGLRNRIHLSQETADLLKSAGKGHWCIPRTDVVVAKGKGQMSTFWLLPRDGSSAADFHRETNQNTSNSTTPAVKGMIPEPSSASPKIKRLVEWNVDVLKKLLCLIVARRQARTTHQSRKDKLHALEKAITKKQMPLSEVREVVVLPAFDAKHQQTLFDSKAVTLDTKVVEQLRDYVMTIATMYRENPFHNFEHASHVTMSVSKLLSRIVAPDIDILDDSRIAENLHDHTYGITSDPLTQFAVVISALVHDVDHVGISNALLIKENSNLGEYYKSKSVAEQNSVDIAWRSFMEPRFADLRNCLYTNTDELQRFRQLLVNTVLATDIFDKELQTLRRSRWEKAFSENASVSSSKEEHQIGVNRKATIVIEHLIQASDVAHTMQHWHIYQKWNERLFTEMMMAYKSGRSDKDPSSGWYQGELGFFDHYIIPLAKKLQDCGVFGVSSDEYLNYALENRKEWAKKGEEVVAKMIAKHSSARTMMPDGSTLDDAGKALPANASPYDK